MVIWVPGSPIDCADTIPADSFASITWRSNFRQIFSRTSWRRFLLSLRPWIFFATSVTTNRGSHRPISLSPSAISCSPELSGSAFTGIVRGVSGSASAAFAAGFFARTDGRAFSRRGAGFTSTGAAPSFLRTFSASFFAMNFASRAALDAAGRIHAVLAELELDDRVRRVPDRPVVLDFEVFEGVDQPALHVPRPRRPDGRVDEPFPTSHRVEEVLRRVEATLVRRLDEPFRLRAEVALPEVRQRAVPVAAAQSLATDRLLSNRPRHLRRLVDELPRGVRAVVPRELVHDLALERADRVLVDRPRGDDPVLDHDEGVFLFQFLQADVPFRRNRRFERHAQVLRKDRGEQRLPGPELLAALLDIRRREVANVDLAQDICDLLPGELALLVR